MIHGEPLRLLIAQPFGDGHYLVLYVRHILREARRRGWATDLMTTEEATATPAFRLLEQEAGGTLGVAIMPHVARPVPTLVRLLGHQIAVTRALRRGFDRYLRGKRADVVFVPDLDRCSKGLALMGSPFGSTPFAGMVIAAKHHHRAAGLPSSGSRNDAVWEWLFDRSLRLRTLGAVGTTDGLLVRYLQRNRPPGFDKVCYVPEPGTVDPADRRVVRGRLGIDADKVVVLVYGSLEARKGIAELLAAAARPGTDPRIVVVVAGKESPESAGILAADAARDLTEQGRLIRQHGFLDLRAEAELFAAADVVWVGYTGFDLGSGVMIQAGAAQRPVIACERGLIGYRATRHGLGPVVDPASPDAVVSALNRLASNPDERAAFAANTAAYAARHTPERFARGACDAIEQAQQRVMGRSLR